ncbi:hypothetical protein EIP86_001101 [Pleurotus ostreatoroseus]|nr:hypothetical protein EIP86_001101 [Pleurotus ostreatoroseus]
MTNLYDDCWRGTLTADRLALYLSVTDIDSVGGSKSLTPLAAACCQGHLNVVTLLLDNPYKLADPNALSPRNRTPLYYATTHSPPLDRAAIVQWLLKAGADPDACSSEDGLCTPLMNAITQVKDKDVVHELMDRGASVSYKNARGETPLSLAKGTSLETAVSRKEELSSMATAIVDMVVSVIMLILAVTNSPQIKGIVEGIVNKLAGTTGANLTELSRPEVAKDIADPKVENDVMTNLNAFVEDCGLEKFFPAESTFMQALTKKAAALRNDSSTTLGSPMNIDRLTYLSLYQLVIYCDDSASMAVHNRFDSQRELVKRIARIATRIVPDTYGVELRFINATLPATSCALSAAQVDQVVAAVRPSSGSKLGTGLRNKILKPLVYDVLADPARRFERPLLVTVITDGQPDPEPLSTFKDAIVECRRKLVNAGYEPNAVMFSISRIGDDPRAKEFLRELQGNVEIEDVLYCTTDRLDDEFKHLRANERRLEAWLLKVLTEPLVGTEV